MAKRSIKTNVVVLGSGPGGYTAAFRAADLGKKVVLVERYDTLGGVCLNVGCIPSKALLHVAKVIEETKYMSEHGVSFANPKLDIKKIISWKESVVKRLTNGLKMLSTQRKVDVVHGTGKFTSANEILVEHENETVSIQFENAIIAVGSSSVELPFIPKDPRIFSSTGALELRHLKGEMLVLGGGIIGLEMATVYASLGVKVTVVELANQLIASADKDIVSPLEKRIRKIYKNIYLNSKVTKVTPNPSSIEVTIEEEGKSRIEKFDSVLVAVGRKSNGNNIDAEKAGISVDSKGFISVDSQMRTNISHIYAIGDVVGQPMLAHKAVAEGKIAAECISGLKHFFEPKCIPSVAYTDPEVAWAGITEREAKEKGIEYEKGVFPWAANGRSLSYGRDDGITKILFDSKTQRVIGCGIVGPNAGDLVSEMVLAIEMGCDAEDLALTIHPHPTLSETIPAATEAFLGTITDLYLPKKK